MSAEGLRPRLVAVWVLLAALVIAIAVLELIDRRQRPAESQAEARERMLLPVPLDQLAVIEIAQGGMLYRFERDAAGSWFYHAHGVDTGAQGPHGHQPDPAQALVIEKAFAGFGRTRMERDLEFESGTDPYGVTRPEMLILVYRADDPKPLGQYAVGDIAPDTFSRYVLPLGSPTVVTIANFQIDNLRDLLKATETWSAKQIPTVPQTPRRP